MHSVLIDFVDVSEYVDWKSLNVQLRSSGQGKAEFLLNDSPLTIEEGHNVAVYHHDGHRLFGGSIDEVNWHMTTEADSLVSYQIICTTYEHRLYKRPTRAAAYGERVLPAHATSTFFSPAHPLTANQPIRFGHNGPSSALPSPLSTSTTYYVRDVTTDTFKVSSTAGGAAITLTDSGVGVIYTKWLSKWVIVDLINNHASGEVTTNIATMGDGEFLEPFFVADRSSVGSQIDRITQVSQYVWGVDEDSNLKFHAKSATAAPFNIKSRQSASPSAGTAIMGINYRTSREDYRNVQHTRFEWGAVDPETQTIVGDDSRFYWLDFVPVQIDSIQIDGMEVTVGVDGVDVENDIYWVPGTRGLRIDDASPAPGASNSIVVLYRKLGANYAEGDDSVEIARMAAVEGGSGEYHGVDNTGYLSADQSIQANTAALTTFKTMLKSFQYTTLLTGMKPNQWQRVQFAEFDNLDEYFVVQSVSHWPANDTVMWCRVEMTNASRYNDYVRLFQQMLTSQPTTVSTVLLSSSSGGGATGGVIGYA